MASLDKDRLLTRLRLWQVATALLAAALAAMIYVNRRQEASFSQYVDTINQLELQKEDEWRQIVDEVERAFNKSDETQVQASFEQLHQSLEQRPNQRLQLTGDARDGE